MVGPERASEEVAVSCDAGHEQTLTGPREGWPFQEDTCRTLDGKDGGPFRNYKKDRVMKTEWPRRGRRRGQPNLLFLGFDSPTGVWRMEKASPWGPVRQVWPERVVEGSWRKAATILDQATQKWATSTRATIDVWHRQWTNLGDQSSMSIDDETSNSCQPQGSERFIWGIKIKRRDVS